MTIEKYIRGAFAGMALMAMAATTLTACSTADETDDIATPTTRATINISAADAYDSEEETRSANTGITTASENSINRVFIAALSKSGYVVGTKEIYVNGKPSKYTYEDASSLNMVEGGKVIVAVNCPSSKLSGQTTESGLKSQYVDIYKALHNYGPDDYKNTNASFNNLPMFGEATVSYNGNKNTLSADVFVYHLVSKITLSSITVDPMGGDFTPKEIFMVNVPGQAAITNVTPFSGYTFNMGSTKYTGERTDASCNDNSSSAGLKFLSSELTSWTSSTVNSKNVYSTNMPEFYVTPSSATDLGKGGAIMLVIKGIYNDGTGDETCYYPVPINYITSTGKSADGHDPRTVNPNVNYKLTVSIKGKGSDNPYTVPDKTTVSVNVIAVSFTNKTSPYYYEPVRIGDYLFNDGWWGPIPENSSLITKAHHPVAVIFSNQTSAIDKAMGWTHGYALSLASCGAKLEACGKNENMATLLNNYVNAATNVSKKLINDNYHNPAEATTLDGITSDIDGYIECLSYEAGFSDGSPEFRDSFPSFWYAMNFSTPQLGVTVINGSDCSESNDLTSTTNYALSSDFLCSGWYLGSVGQYYLAARNLGHNFDANDASVSNGQITVTGKAADNIKTINNYINKGSSEWCPGIPISYSSGNYGTWYFTSSSYNMNNEYIIQWSSNGNIYIGRHAKNGVTVNGQNRGVRPVIAW